MHTLKFVSVMLIKHMKKYMPLCMCTRYIYRYIRVHIYIYVQMFFCMYIWCMYMCPHPHSRKLVSISVYTKVLNPNVRQIRHPNPVYKLPDIRSYKPEEYIYMCVYRYIRTPQTLNPIPCVAAAAASARPCSRRGSRVGGLLRRRAYLIVYFLVLKVFKFFFYRALGFCFVL